MVEGVKGQKKHLSNICIWMREEKVHGLHQEVFGLMGNIVLILRKTNITSGGR